MRKVIPLVFSLFSLSVFAGDPIAQEEERKLELLKKEGRGLLCPLVFGKDTFIPKKELTILRKIDREIRHYVVLPEGKVVPLSSCAVVERVTLKEEQK